MRFISVKVFISLLILSTSISAWAQTVSNGNKLKPIYGKGCDASNQKEAEDWLTLLLYTYVESSARSKCGWRFDRREATDLEVIANVQVRKCWGSDMHNFLQKSYKKKAAELTMNCDSADMQDFKSGYAKINDK